MDYGYTYRKKMQQLQYGVNSVSEFTVAHRLRLFRGTSRRIIFAVPSLRPAPRHLPT